MGAPALLVGGHPLGSPGGGGRQCPCGRLRGRERHGAEARAGGRVCRRVYRRPHPGGLGRDARYRRGVGPAHVGQPVREVLPPVNPIGHLARRRSPDAPCFGVRLGPIPHEDRHAGLCLQPLGDRRGFPIREHRERAPSCEVPQERAVSMAPAQGDIIQAEPLWGDQRRAGGATDHPPQGVPTHREAERLAQPCPSSAPKRETAGAQAWGQPSCVPRPRRHTAGQWRGADPTGTRPMAAAELADAEPPRDPVATPRQIGQRP
jgi:hypothetical protein